MYKIRKSDRVVINKKKMESNYFCKYRKKSYFIFLRNCFCCAILTATPIVISSNDSITNCQSIASRIRRELQTINIHKKIEIESPKLNDTTRKI